MNAVGENGRNWHSIGFTTATSSTGDNALNASVVQRFRERADPSIGKPANSANWSLSYDTILLYAQILREARVDGTTAPKVAREAIRDGFMKLKSFSGVQSYTMRETGDMHIPGRVLAVDVGRGEWKFAGG